MANCLVEIKSDDWPRLKELYLPETPATVLGLTTLSNYIRWNECQQRQIENLAIFSLNGDWSDGTFVVVDRYHIYFDSLNESKERLMNLLLLLDYSKGVRIMHVRSKHYPVILEIIKQKHLQLEYDDPNLLYYLTKEQAIRLHYELPNGFHERSLTDSDVVKANNEWAFNHPGSLFYLQRLARLNPNCGVFTNDTNELVSSGFQFQTGPIGTLFTKPEYRHRGLGTSVAKNIFKRIGVLGTGAVATVKSANLISRAIFEKIGCQIIDEIHWIATPCDWTEKEDINKYGIDKMRQERS